MRGTLADAAMPLQGGKLLWLAPSGGRDRPNAEGTWLPAPFDAASVDLMRSLIGMSKRPGHLFPLAMHSGEMMPPPPTLDASIGERRLTSFVGVGARSSCHAHVAGSTCPPAHFKSSLSFLRMCRCWPRLQGSGLHLRTQHKLYRAMLRTASQSC